MRVTPHVKFNILLRTGLLCKERYAAAGRFRVRPELSCGIIQRCENDANGGEAQACQRFSIAVLGLCPFPSLLDSAARPGRRRPAQRDTVIRDVANAGAARRSLPAVGGSRRIGSGCWKRASAPSQRPSSVGFLPRDPGKSRGPIRH